MLGAGGHGGGGDGDGLLAGPAEAVERHAGHGLGPAREEDRQAGDVVAVVPGEDAVAGDDVVDADGVESGARGQCGQALSEQCLRMYPVQCAVGAAFAARRANGIQNPCVDVELPSLRAPGLGFRRAAPPPVRIVFSLKGQGNTA